MIRLKLTRDELACLCWLCNPFVLEAMAIADIRKEDLNLLSDSFALIELGEKAAKKLLFDQKQKYKLSLTWAQAAAFWNFGDWNEKVLDDYKKNFIQSTRSTLHGALVNYQRRFYARQH